MKGIRFVLRRAKQPEEVAVLPSWLVRQLEEWADAVLDEPRPYRKPPGWREAWLFTDASLYGWGAVLALDNGCFSVVGKSWRRSHVSGDISEPRRSPALSPSLRTRWATH
jgi:hypothetical protein